MKGQGDPRQRRAALRLVTYQLDGAGEARPGALVGDAILDLIDAWPRAAGDAPRTLRRLLERGPAALDAAREAVAATRGHMIPVASAKLLPPVPAPEKYFCVGKNYPVHLDELRRNDLIRERPNEPTGFIKLNAVLVGQDAAVARPDGIVQFDYEPELVYVIGKPAYRVSKEHALDYVAGVTLLNDLTAREIQKREVASGSRFWTAKNMPGFGPTGPAIVTLDEIADPLAVWITCAVNGAQRMRVNTREQIFKIGDILEHFSRYMPFRPGDFIATGAPGGVAVGQPNAAELFLKPGDVIEVGMEGIMALRTRIVAPSAGYPLESDT